MIKKLLLALLVLGIVAALVVVLRTPSTDRVWKEYLSVPTEVSFSPDEWSVTLTHIRDWTYSKEGPLTKDYVDETYEILTLTKMWFIVEPFPSQPKFGHTFLVFEFENAPPVAFSVEAMIEEGESYSAIKGLFNEYELAYTWGTERDFLTRRAVMLEHELYRYELNVSPLLAQDVFRSFLKGTQGLTEKPVFYNTITHNCTNELAHLIEAHGLGELPWDWSRLLTGTADAYLFKLGYIQGESFEQAKTQALVTERVRELNDSPDFSNLLRK